MFPVVTVVASSLDVTSVRLAKKKKAIGRTSTRVNYMMQEPGVVATLDPYCMTTVAWIRR